MPSTVTMIGIWLASTLTQSCHLQSFNLLKLQSVCTNFKESVHSIWLHWRVGNEMEMKSFIESHFSQTLVNICWLTNIYNWIEYVTSSTDFTAHWNLQKMSTIYSFKLYCYTIAMGLCYTILQAMNYIFWKDIT